MDKKEQKRLVKELTLKISERKELANNMGSSVYRMQTVFNKKYLSQDEEILLEALKSFLEVNPYLTKEEVKVVLSSNKKLFKFLIDCETRYFDFFEIVKNSMGLLKHRIAHDKKSDEILNRKLP